MKTDFKLLEKRLAEQKVYDAWQYVQSLHETLAYMQMSYEMICKVYEHRKNVLISTQNEMFETAVKNESVSISQDDLSKTNLDLAGYKIDDIAFLRKTSIEFFHYARVSIDVLFQIINAGLLGDEAYEITERGLLGKVTKKLTESQNFTGIHQLLSQIKDDDEFKYLSAFDNYVKHIKTILIVVKNSFMIGNTNEIFINQFLYDGVSYSQVSAIDKIKVINNYVIKTVDDILVEMINQVPNCLDNSQRVQKIKFKMQIQKNENGEKIDFIDFFVEVENDLNELPGEIKVYPLIVKPNDEIYGFDFSFDKLFIKKRNASSENDSIIGYAELKNGLETNEFYRIYEVKECSFVDYLRYMAEFKSRTQKIKMNFYAMEGEIIAYESKNLK